VAGHPLEALAQRVLDAAGPAGPRPRIVAVDGRSASGKTTLAGRLGQVIAGSAVVHTDDIAWWHSALDWSELMIDGVLAPVRRGEAVRLRPPAWEARGPPRRRRGAGQRPWERACMVVSGTPDSAHDPDRPPSGRRSAQLARRQGSRPGERRRVREVVGRGRVVDATSAGSVVT
jgi:hypothetical protein